MLVPTAERFAERDKARQALEKKRTPPMKMTYSDKPKKRAAKKAAPKKKIRKKDEFTPSKTEQQMRKRHGEVPPGFGRLSPKEQKSMLRKWDKETAEIEGKKGVMGRSPKERKRVRINPKEKARRARVRKRRG